MIFSIGDHIKQIIEGTKTQTRRSSGAYFVGQSCSIQPRRTAPGISQGRILIIEKRVETYPPHSISVEDAKAEGGYDPTRFEILYAKMYKGWRRRYAYTFKFVPTCQKSETK